MTAQNPEKIRAPRNRTIGIKPSETDRLRALVSVDARDFRNKVIGGDAFAILEQLPASTFDLLFADPPYNLTKSFGEESFRRTSLDEYEAWLDSWLVKCVRLLKPTSSVYICGDWRSAAAIQRVGMKYFRLRNRITWEREKGRGAKRNWKNSSEDIWFFTVSDDFVFNTEAVKMKRRVIAPYTENGEPKDWERSPDGDFRLTHPSNLWTDLTVPFWSMPENTDHPTQKPEKLLAKIVLASTNAGQIVLDPFAGSGTAAVVAKKLGRDFCAIESDGQYCLLAQKRLELAESDTSIQGFEGGIFFERNSKSR
ncbi:MAG: site-specific DNA-methyltransferase [Acidobacteria bacterium]|nr:site-specific DNA-methyltransferase [Acidobacteriota bacterium]